MSLATMTRQQLLHEASKQIGYPIDRHIIVYAHKIGAVSDPQGMPNSWRRYSRDHLEQFVGYLQRRIEGAR